MNNAITIEVGAPLLRPGLTIRTSTSETYAAVAADRLIQLARDINDRAKPPIGAAKIAMTKEQ